MPENSKRPDWWEWDLEFSGHLYRRMAERQFSEIDLRAMLADPSAVDPDVEPGRWLVLTEWHGRRWEVVVEPDASVRRVVVITAYGVE